MPFLLAEVFRCLSLVGDTRCGTRPNFYTPLDYWAAMISRTTPKGTCFSDSIIFEVRREGKVSSRLTVLYATNLAPIAVKIEGDAGEDSAEYADPIAVVNTQLQLTETCEVCADNLTPELRLTEPITQRCKHPIQIGICKTCVEHHIRVQIASYGWDKISCPATDCHQVFEYTDLQTMASRADFERYDNYLFEKAVEDDTSSDYRRCAHTDCIDGGWCDPEKESFMTCPTCAQRTCIECEVIWHTDNTCAEHQEEVRIQKEKEVAARAAIEAESAQYIQETFKACPNQACGYGIEKSGGCDHMTCRKCWHEFCWLCDAEYKKVRRLGNIAHEEDCRYHSMRLD